MATILITGAGTGIGNLTARALARAGHTVYASMRDTDTEPARELRQLASRDGLALRTITLDVQSGGLRPRRGRKHPRRSGPA